MLRTFEGGKDFDFIKKIINMACSHLKIDSSEITIGFERIGNEFQDIKIGATTSDKGNKIHININMDWYENTSDQDIKYLIWHETYHAYQFLQIRYMNHNTSTIEPLDIIRRWETEGRNYIPNTPATEEKHFRQRLEADAYYFSLAMLFKYECNADGSIDIGIPPEIEKNLDDGVEHMFKKYFIHTITKNATQKIGRNDLCPCGSGKKYKKCCGKHPNSI